MVIRTEAMVGEGQVGSEAGVDEGRGDVAVAVVGDGGEDVQLAKRQAQETDRQKRLHAMRACVRESDVIVQSY